MASTISTSFPTGEDKKRVSRNGGFAPRWRKDGRELFFITGRDEVAAVTMAPGLEIGEPQVLFATDFVLYPFEPQWEVLGNGDSFLLASLSPLNPMFTVVLNWTAELER